MAARMPTIPEAFCLEHGRVEDIEILRSRFLDSDAPPKLSFCCPNEACRKLPAPPVIDAVNLFEKTYKKAPHFRWRSKSHAHAPGCLAQGYGSIRDAIIREHGDKPISGIDLVPGSHLNAFNEYIKLIPGEVIDELVVCNDPNTKQNTQSVNYCSHQNIRHAITHLHSKKTSFLSVVVDQFREMTAKEKKRSRLVLRNTGLDGAMTWREAFVPFPFATPDFGLRIFYGLARCYAYRDTYRILFTAAENREGLVEAPFSKITRLANERDTFKLLKKYGSRDKHKKLYLCCYILGMVHRRRLALPGQVARDFMVIEEASLRHIVVRETPSQDPYKMNCETNDLT